jgi:L-malate glycosyltransferase
MDDGCLRVGLIGPLPPASGGMASQTRQLAELLMEGGHVVTLVQVNMPYWPAWVGRIPLLRAVFRLVPYAIALWKAAGQVDIFHVMANSGWSWHLFAVPAIWMGHRRGVPVASFLEKSSWWMRLTMERSSALIVPSAFLQGIFSRYGMVAEIVPNVVDLTLFSAPQRILSDSPHLLVARNLEALYDNETAILAFQRVRDIFPDARLTLAGCGPLELRLRQTVSALGLESSVQFTGRLDRDAMALLYRSADLLLNPSLADNMPNTVLEAWSSGVPVVSTNVGGIPCLVQDGVTASLVPPGDPLAMAQACLRLLTNGSLWRQRVETGQREVLRYTWPCIQPVLIGVYHKTLKRPIFKRKEMA